MDETTKPPDLGLANVRQVADYLHVSIALVYQMLRDHELPSILVRGSRRLRWSDVKEYVNQHQQQTYEAR